MDSEIPLQDFVFGWALCLAPARPEHIEEGMEILGPAGDTLAIIGPLHLTFLLHHLISKRHIAAARHFTHP